ncbi:hypothetical protein [Cupriavidus taiwanensis]|uniref:hypothetical protein n=1 Tax=Cupriavidus taiwanensis TaxID=164546 RepID=UPI0011AE98B5|nr:hypothetical protein [Cupriavidus taiwanensis]
MAAGGGIGVERKDVEILHRLAPHLARNTARLALGVCPDFGIFREILLHGRIDGGRTLGIMAPDL